MTVSRSDVNASDVIARYRPLIEAHLVGLTAGHDPFGHLFAVERLARAARADLWAARPTPDRRERPG
jgi:hypothetical protein